MTSSRFFPVLNDRARQLATVTLIWLGIGAGSIFLYLFNPTNPPHGVFFPNCPFRTLTGWQCPGCGSTRACYQLLHLHPIAAFKLNPLMVLTLPFIVYGLLSFTNHAIMGKPQRRIFIPNVYLWTWLSVIVFFWIFRNTPWYPFVS